MEVPGDLTASTREAGFTRIKAWDAGFSLACLLEILESYVLAANVNQPGEHRVVFPIKANYLNCQGINRRADRRPTGMVKPKIRKVHLLLA